jgi:hypothetical protein
MGDNLLDLASLNSITSDAKGLIPGSTIPITISGSVPITGFLLYAVGSDPDSRVGSFELINGSKPAEGCGEFVLDAPESVLTHSAPGAFTCPTFMYTVPMNFTEISFNAIVVQRIATGGYAWGILIDSLILNATEYATTPGATSCTVETVTETKTVIEVETVMVRKNCRRRGDGWSLPTLPTQALY